MPDATILELEQQLIAARARIEELTRANTDLAGTLAATEIALRRSRRNARQDGNSLRDQISDLQNRRH